MTVSRLAMPRDPAAIATVCPGLMVFAGVEIPDFAPRGARNIVNARRVEALANPKHVGVLHVEPPVLEK